MARIAEWFRSLPRSARWGVAAALVFGAYFLIIEPVLDLKNRHAAAADGIENNLRRASELGSDDSDDGRLLVTVAKNYGRPGLPSGGGASRAGALQRAIDEVLKDHGVTNSTRTERNADLTGDKARAVAGDGTITRYIVEVSFDANQIIVARILADLEQSAEVTSVSSVHIDRTSIGSRFFEEADKPSTGMVHAVISAESWVLSRTRGASSNDTDSSGAPL